MKQSRLTPKYVEYIPDHLNEGVLYISEQYRTASHKCCCGCGEEVVTALTPADWAIQKEGHTVTLYPSIGNWSFACRSHYWIRKNEVIWAKGMSQKEVARVRQKDEFDKAKYIASTNLLKERRDVTKQENIGQVPKHEGLLEQLWKTLKKWWHS